MTKATTFVFGPDGGIPNSRLSLAFWRGRLSLESRDGEAACALYRRNGWTGTWVYTVYPFWHFHTRGHEVLACVSGTATIGFGGDGGEAVDVEAGDVCIIPAGVGHRRLSATGDFLMAGGYPPGQSGDIVRPGVIGVEEAARRAAAVPLPQSDPVSGAGGIVDLWRQAADTSA